MLSARLETGVSPTSPVMARIAVSLFVYIRFHRSKSELICSYNSPNTLCIGAVLQPRRSWLVLQAEDRAESPKNVCCVEDESLEILYEYERRCLQDGVRSRDMLVQQFHQLR